MRLLDRLFGTPEEINGGERCPTYLWRWTILKWKGKFSLYLHHLPKSAPKRTGKRGIGPAEGETLKPPKGQEQLPGFEDTAIPQIENAARRYAEARDERIAAGVVEKQRKDVLMAAMHAAEKKHYKRDGIECEIVPEGEKLKVRIKAEDSE